MPGLPPEIFASTLALLEELVSISSPSGDLAGVAAAERRYGAELERHGLRVEITDEPGVGDVPAPVLTARGPRARDRYLLVIGHLDTVLPAVPPRRRDGRLEATGAVDMKGGLAAFAGALDLLGHQGREAPDDVLVVVVPDEEIAGPLTRAKVESLGAGARALWSLEPGQLRGEGDDQRETIVIGRRGMFHWRLEVRGRAPPTPAITTGRVAPPSPPPPTGASAPAPSPRPAPAPRSTPAASSPARPASSPTWPTAPRSSAPPASSTSSPTAPAARARPASSTARAASVSRASSPASPGPSRATTRSKPPSATTRSSRPSSPPPPAVATPSAPSPSPPARAGA